MADSTSKSYSSDPTLWLYTSLSSGSSQIVTATSRLETILKANRIPFKALDVATDEKARMLWGRRAGKRRLPGLDIDEIEEWNEYGELKEQVGAVVPAARNAEAPIKTTTAAVPASGASPVSTASNVDAVASKAASTPSGSKPASSISFAPEKSKEESGGGAQASISLAMRQLGQEAAERAKKNKSEALATRKAQAAAAAAEKLDNSAAIPAPIGITSTESAKAPENAAADAHPKVENVSLMQSKNVTSSETSDLDSTEEVEPESKVSTTSGANATRPESPLPNPGESVTAMNHDTSIVSQSTAAGADASRSESPLPAAGEAKSVQSATDRKPAETPQTNVSTLSSVADAQKTMPGTEIGKHRGSSISIVSKEEIKQVEEASKITEEPEEDAEEDAMTIDHKKPKDELRVQLSGERQGDEADREKEELSADGNPKIVDKKIINVDSSKGADKKQKAESPKVVETVKTQEQPAADPAKAIESVHD